MVYSTSKCPSCGQVIRRQTNPVKEIDIPFERCRHCGKIYLNSYKEEWITKSPISRFFFFLQAGVWARAFALPALIIFPIEALNWDTDIFFALWPLFSLAWLFCGYFLHRNAAQNAISASIARTNDPEYVNLLKQAGYSIYPLDNIPTAVNTQPEAPMNSHKKTTEHTLDVREENDEKSVVHAYSTPPAFKHTNNMKYCSRCGSPIDNETKICTGCGKQYFKGIRFTKHSAAILVLSLLLAYTATACAVQHFKIQNLNAELLSFSEQNSSLQVQVSGLQNHISYLQQVTSSDRKLIDFIDEYVVFVEDDGTDLYHKYDCHRFKKASFWAYNTEAAIESGYRECPYCH